MVCGKRGLWCLWCYGILLEWLNYEYAWYSRKETILSWIDCNASCCTTMCLVNIAIWTAKVKVRTKSWFRQGRKKQVYAIAAYHSKRSNDKRESASAWNKIQLLTKSLSDCRTSSGSLSFFLIITKSYQMTDHQIRWDCLIRWALWIRWIPCLATPQKDARKRQKGPMNRVIRSVNSLSYSLATAVIKNLRGFLQRAGPFVWCFALWIFACLLLPMDYIYRVRKKNLANFRVSRSYKDLLIVFHLVIWITD